MEKLKCCLQKSRDFWIDHLADSAELLEQNDENIVALEENLKALQALKIIDHLQRQRDWQGVPSSMT